MNKCSCGACLHHTETDFRPYQNLDNEPHGWYDKNFNDCANFCPHCGDKLLHDGTVESRAEVDKVLGHFHCAGCLHEKQSDHYEPCTYCKRKYEDEYTPIKQEATE